MEVQQIRKVFATPSLGTSSLQSALGSNDDDLSIVCYKPNSTNLWGNSSCKFIKVCYHDNRNTTRVQVHMTPFDMLLNVLVVRSTTQKDKAFPRQSGIAQSYQACPIGDALPVFILRNGQDILL